MRTETRAAAAWDVLVEALRGSDRDYTEGSISRAVLMLAVPMIAEQLMESVFAIVDIFVVSKLGADAVAAVGITESLLTPIFALAMGLSMATGAVVARRAGERDPEGVARTAIQTIVLGMGISLLLGVPLALFAPELMSLLGASDAVVQIGTPYARLMLGGNATILLLCLINDVFRGVGDAAVAMRALWLGNGINIVLAPCLVLGLGPFPALGVTGAAIATGIGRSVAVVYLLRELATNRRVAICRRHIRLHAATLLSLVRISAAGVLQVTIGTASWLCLVRIVATFGSAAMAGYTIGIRIILFVLLPCYGLANAAATIVGQSLGARKPERAERAVWLAGGYNTLVLSAIGVALVAFAGPVMRRFSTDPEVLRHGAACLRIIGYGFPLYGLGMVLPGAFNGAGDTWTPTLMNLFCFWICEIPIAYALSQRFGLGPQGVFWAIAFAFSALAVVSVVAFRRGRWKEQKV